MSTFYGIRGYCIAKDAPWWERAHQVWFNFAASLFGWLLGNWGLGRLSALSPLGLVDAMLLLVAVLGVVGYLPQALNATSNLVLVFSRSATGILKDARSGEAR